MSASKDPALQLISDLWADLGCVDNQLSQISAAAMEINASNLLSSLS